ncbi:MAG TPA: hypothetical protein VF158_14510 [Longimicrobiales bacterium]
MPERNHPPVEAQVLLSIRLTASGASVEAVMVGDEARGEAFEYLGDGGHADALARALPKAVHSLRVALAYTPCPSCEGHGAYAVPHEWGPEYEAERPCYCEDGVLLRDNPHPFSYYAERKRAEAEVPARVA